MMELCYSMLRSELSSNSCRWQEGTTIGLGRMSKPSGVARCYA